MELLTHLSNGFAVAFQPHNLFYVVVGVLWGTAIGVLPGLGTLAGMSLLLPLTFQLEPATAIIMLAGIFYGTVFGSSTTAILMRIPGAAMSIVLCYDGYAMARKGRAGPALVVAAVCSFIGGTVSVIGLMLFAPPLARIMLNVGPSAMFVLMVLALIVVSFVSASSPIKTLGMVVLGVVFATVGLDPITAQPRFTFGNLELSDGVNFIAVAMGLFGVSEILMNLEKIADYRVIRPTLRSLIPQWRDLREAMPACGRGTAIGFMFGFIPGISHVLSTFVSYAVERRLDRDPSSFGTGRIAGVAGPEAANNATTGSCMVPLLVLGVPAIPSTALLLSALLIHGINPGPQLVRDHPDIFWGLIASMYVGNFVLLLLNLPLVGMFVNLLRVPYPYLAPSILMVCVIGIFSISASTFDIWLMIFWGVLGYGLRKVGFDVAPLLLALILGGEIEVSLRRSLAISQGDYSVFFQGAALNIEIIALILLAAYLIFSRFMKLNVGSAPGDKPG